MSERSDDLIDEVIVLGAGTAGFLAALTLKRELPQLKVTVVRSLSIPIIGVGESTTRAVPAFLHNHLALDRREFYRQVRPTWKLGIRFQWGPPDGSHFNYPFDGGIHSKVEQLPKTNAYYCLEDMTDASRYSAMMDRNLVPVAASPDGTYQFEEGFGYHVHNAALIPFLEGVARERGIEIVDGDVVEVVLAESGDVAALGLADGRRLAADLFVDCSGFHSLLLGKTLGERFVEYGDTLFCDRAVVGSWKRTDELLPYTTTETMDSGWCWRIEFEDHVTRGYVFSSSFCSDDEAMRELKAKNAQLGDDLRVVKFRAGRYENYWKRNVVAIGNSSGFAEPLEATALQHITELCKFMCLALRDNGCRRVTDKMRELENRRFRWLWDDLRDFLAIHYRFNRRLDTPFWRYCREKTCLAGAEELVGYYREVGPSILGMSLVRSCSIFGYNGYLCLLIGQRVETKCRNPLGPEELRIWGQYRQFVRNGLSRCVTAGQAMQLVHHPGWQWPG